MPVTLEDRQKAIQELIVDLMKGAEVFAADFRTELQASRKVAWSDEELEEVLVLSLRAYINMFIVAAAKCGLQKHHFIQRFIHQE